MEFSVIYIITVIALFIGTILLKKNEKKIEIVKCIVFTSGLFLAYNTFICYVLNLINVQITLLNLSIVNIVLFIGIISVVIRKKQIQKYYLKKTNIVAFIVFIILASLIVNINFNGLNKIRYISFDARQHYMVGREFSENTQLTNKAQNNNSFNKSFMPGAYTNIGILFKALQPFVGTVRLYKAFIIFDTFIFILTGIVFFFLLDKYINNVIGKIIAIVFSLIYAYGYPLNSWISGFQYLSLGILYIEIILYLFEEKEGKIDNGIKLSIMFLLNLGLILSYSLFCPYIYLAEFIIIIYNAIKNNNGEKNKKIIINAIATIIITLVIPGIIGTAYIIMQTEDKLISSIAIDGWIYKNLWSNFVLLIPFTIYNLYKELKTKKIFSFKNVTLLLLVLFMIALFVGTKVEIISEYYFYKNYFILWILLFMNFIQGLLIFLKEELEKKIPILYCTLYLVIFIAMVINQKTYCIETNSDSFRRVMEIYTFNTTMMKSDDAFLWKDELDFIFKIEKHIDWKKDNYLIISDPSQQNWIQGLTGYSEPFYNDGKGKIAKIKNKEYKYIAIFKNTNLYEMSKDILDMTEYSLIEENEIGKIYIKKGE